MTTILAWLARFWKRGKAARRGVPSQLRSVTAAMNDEQLRVFMAYLRRDYLRRVELARREWAQRAADIARQEQEAKGDTWD